MFRTNAPAGGSAGWTQRGGEVYVSFNVKEVWLELESVRI